MHLGVILHSKQTVEYTRTWFSIVLIERTVFKMTHTIIDYAINLPQNDGDIIRVDLII